MLRPKRSFWYEWAYPSPEVTSSAPTTFPAPSIDDIKLGLQSCPSVLRNIKAIVRIRPQNLCVSLIKTPQWGFGASFIGECETLSRRPSLDSLELILSFASLSSFMKPRCELEVASSVKIAGTASHEPGQEVVSHNLSYIGIARRRGKYEYNAHNTGAPLLSRIAQSRRHNLQDLSSGDIL
jgi:hypothetical protein